MKANMDDLIEDLYDLTRQFGVSWNTFNLVRYMAQNNVILNKKLTVDDLEENMQVWNATQREYQRIRYICPKGSEDYHWCDGWGNIIENDELWKYEKGEE